MNRRRNPMQYYQSNYLSQNVANSGTYIPAPFPMPPAGVTPGCFVPQNYYYLRYPGFQSYSQFAYTGLPVPFPGMDGYRLVTPVTALQQPPVTYPVQLPPGYQLIRPPTIPLSTSNPIGPTRVRSPRSEDLLGDNSENQNDVNDKGDGAGQSSNAVQNAKKSKRNETMSTHRKCHSSSFGKNRSTSSNRPHYRTSYRHKAKRKQLLNAKQLCRSRNSFSTNEVSSITRLNSTDDHEYETCDESDDKDFDSETNFDDESDWIKDGLLSQTSFQRDQGSHRSSNTSFMDYTIITNDKSYSYVNFNPENLPLKMGRMWLEPRISELIAKETDERGCDKKYDHANNISCVPQQPEHCSQNLKHVVDDGINVASELTQQEQRTTGNSKQIDEQRCASIKTNKTPPQLNICKPSVSENMGINETFGQDRDLWWDNSTDIGIKSSATTSKINSSSSLHSQNSGESLQLPSDKTVLSKESPRKCEDISENMEAEKTQNALENSLRRNQNNCDVDPRKEEVTINNVRTSGSTLKVKTVIKQTAPQHCSSLAFGNGSSDKSNGCKIIDSLENHLDNCNSDVARGELRDEDDAIVAVIQHDISDLNDNDLQRSDSLNDDVHSKIFRQKEVYHHHCSKNDLTSDMFSSIDALNLRETMMSILVRNSDSLTSGVKSLPCSPFASDTFHSDPLFRSCSSSAIKDRPESAVTNETRVCTPHSKTISHWFCRINSDKTFSLELDREKCDNFEQQMNKEKSKECFQKAEASEKNKPFIEKRLMFDENLKLYSQSNCSASSHRNFSQSRNSKVSDPAVKNASDNAKKSLITCSGISQMFTLNNQLGKLPENRSGFSDGATKRFSTDNSCLLKYMDKAAAFNTQQSAASCSRNALDAVANVHYFHKQTPDNRYLEQQYKQDKIAHSVKQDSENNISRQLAELPSELPVQPTSDNFSSDSVVHNFNLRTRPTELSLSIASPKVSSAENPKANDDISTACVTSKIQSDIKSRVQKLLDYSSRGRAGPVYSPCLASLQATGLNKQRFNFFPYHSIIFPSNCAKILSNQTASLPPSPKRPTGLNSFQRSISLSDVFYDSTTDDSVMLNSKSKTISLSLSTISDSMQQMVNQQYGKGTYVSYPLPTLTPSDQSNYKEDETAGRFANIFDLKPLSPKKKQVETVQDKDREIFSSSDEKRTVSSSSPDQRSQKLDSATETELRKSAQVLIDSVNENQRCLRTVTPCSKFESAEEPAVQSPLSSSVRPAQKLQQNNNDRHAKQSLDQSTQTPERFLEKVDGEKDFTSKLLFPPKKPPRSKSPSTAEKPLKNNQQQEFGNIPSVQVLPLNCGDSEEAQSICYYPFVAISGSPPAETHLISPSFLPRRINQHILRSPCVPPISFCPLPVNGMNKKETELELDVKQSTKCGKVSDFSGKKQDSFKRSTGSSNLLSGSETSSATFNTRAYPTTSKEVSSWDSSVVPYILIPYSNRPNAGFLNPYSHVVRRRSFSEVSSSAIDKARLNRRNMNLLMAKRPYMAKPMKPRLANASHPAGKRVSRRPRFVKSSLSEDTVYDVVKQRNGSFMTKPAKSKVEHALRDNARADVNNLPKANGKSANEKTEPGYSSGNSPEKEKVNKKNEEKQNLDPTTSNCFRDLTDDSREKSQNKETKKPNRFSTLQRTLKKMIPGKRLTKQTSPVNEEELKEHPGMKRSKTDSKLLEELRTHVGKKRTRELFGRSKKLVALTDDESTLKAESRLKTPVSLVKISDACAQKIGKASTTFTETGFHQVNELKKILLNANFAEQISLKANGINGCESGPSNCSLTDCSAASIDRQCDKCSASTPGVRINSETGDVIGEEVPLEKIPAKEIKNKRHHKLLSSTAIDE